MPPKPFLYFVTPDIGNDINKWISLIHAAVDGGIDMLQIRDKTSSKSEIFNAAKIIQPVLKKAGIPLIINDHVDLALALQADGVHLGQSDGNVSIARNLLGKQSIIGLSIESIDQVEATRNLSLNYLAASPVFETGTKLNCKRPWGLNGLRQLISKTSLPVVAIGGIHLENSRSILDCGVAGLAIVSAIAAAHCPRQATTEFVDLIKRNT